MANAKERYCVSDHGEVIGCYRTKAQAQKIMASEVRSSAKSCRKSYRRCSVIGSTKDGSVKIMIGGRQGYHMWSRFVLNDKRPRRYL